MPGGVEQAQTQICFRGALQDVTVGFFQDEMFSSLQLHLGIRKSSCTAGYRTSSSWFACCDIQIQSQGTRDMRQPHPFSPAPHNTLSKATLSLTQTSSGTKEQCSCAYNSLLQ